MLRLLPARAADMPDDPRSHDIRWRQRLQNYRRAFDQLLNSKRP